MTFRVHWRTFIVILIIGMHLCVWLSSSYLYTWQFANCNLGKEEGIWLNQCNGIYEEVINEWEINFFCGLCLLNEEKCNWINQRRANFQDKENGERWSLYTNNNPFTQTTTGGFFISRLPLVSLTLFLWNKRYKELLVNKSFLLCYCLSYFRTS